MSRRDDFGAQTKRLAAERAGYMCSQPDCRRSLIGPARRDPTKSVNLGIAAHIRAASDLGPRFSREQTPEQRAAVDNCIFLCADHASLIDKNDGIDYPAPLLHMWKATHELWVADRVQRWDLPTSQFDAVNWEINTESVQIGQVQTLNVTTSSLLESDPVPSRSERILAERADYWPYHLFMAGVSDGVSVAQRERRITLNRIALPEGPLLSMREAPDAIASETDAATELTSAVEPILNTLFTEAIVLEGDSDAELIQHCADQVVELYRGLIQWAARVRSLRVPGELRRARQLVSQLADRPMDEIEAWAGELGHLLDNWGEIEQWAENEEAPTLTLALVLTSDDEVVAALQRELDAVARSL